MYSILKDEPLDESAEEGNPPNGCISPEAKHIVYNPKIPPEFFDFIHHQQNTTLILQHLAAGN